MEPHPVQLSVTDDLGRGRASVFFRIILAIPVIVWLVIWSIGVFFVAIAGWFVALFTKRLPNGIHDFLCSYIRYVTHVHAYVALVAEPYPGFGGKPGYPVDVTLPEPEEQSRWRIFLRFVLALPAIAISELLGGSVGFNSNWSSFHSSGSGGNHSFRFATFTGGGGVLLFVVAFLAWFVGVFGARGSKGLRDAGAYAIGYTAHVLGYLLLVTERYPLSDPNALLGHVEPPPAHPVHVVDDDDLRRSRLTVFFRLLLFIPHYVWLALWSIAVFFSVFANWFVTLFSGTPASSLHRFNSRFVRYSFHIYSFLFLVANPFPGFTGEPGSYPVDLVLPEPARQNRWKTGFRFVLVVPALFVSYALILAVYVVAVLLWFVALVRGSAPPGLHRLGVYSMRYQAQSNAYYLLLTDVYPHASPLEGAEPPPAPEPTGEPQYAW